MNASLSAGFPFMEGEIFAKRCHFPTNGITRQRIKQKTDSKARNPGESICNAAESVYNILV